MIEAIVVVVARMVGVVKGNSAHPSQPLRNIEHVFAVVAERHEGVGCGMKQPLSATFVPQPVIARVFREYCWIGELLQETPCRLPGEIDSEACREPMPPCPNVGSRLAA